MSHFTGNNPTTKWAIFAHFQNDFGGSPPYHISWQLFPITKYDSCNPVMTCSLRCFASMIGHHYDTMHAYHKEEQSYGTIQEMEYIVNNPAWFSVKLGLQGRTEIMRQQGRPLCHEYVQYSIGSKRSNPTPKLCLAIWSTRKWKVSVRACSFWW
jgi:hypothetical protein